MGEIMRDYTKAILNYIEKEPFIVNWDKGFYFGKLKAAYEGNQYIAELKITFNKIAIECDKSLIYEELSKLYQKQYDEKIMNTFKELDSYES